MSSYPYTFVARESAEEFLAALNPNSEYFREHSRGDWLFRGQEEAHWKLVPSALRDDAKSLDGEGIRARSASAWGHSERQQWEFELRLVRGFYEIANRNRLRIPENSPDVRACLERNVDWYITESLNSKIPTWPPSPLQPLLALAQHHSVPTRLLDWTESSRIAAYFACRAFATRGLDPAKERGRRMSVWAMLIDGPPTRHVSENVDWVRRAKIDLPERLKIVRVPYADNPNLAAQQGLFTLVLAPFSDPASPSQQEPLDEKIAVARIATSGPPRFPDLIEFTLPKSEAPRLLRLLHAEGVDGATVFPGFDGASLCLLERSFILRNDTARASGIERAAN